MSPHENLPRCPRCNGPMSSGGTGVAILCGPDGQSSTLTLPEQPPSCVNPECRAADRAARDEAAIARAVEAGIIDP